MAIVTNQEFPLIISFFAFDNRREEPIQSFPFKANLNKNYCRLLFPFAPSYLHCSFLSVDTSQNSFCYISQNEDFTYVLLTNYLHWSFFINLLNHLIQLPPPQRVLFLSSLNNLIPPPSLLQLNYPLFSFSSPLPQPLHNPTSGNLSLLFSLPINSLLLLLSCFFNERRILIQSQSAEKVSQFIVCLLEIFTPFKWQHLIVPVLPIKYTELIQSPTPFIIGVDPSVMEIVDLTDIVVFVDIDKGMVRSNDSNVIKTDFEVFPKKWLTSLSNRLSPLYSPSIETNDKNRLIKVAFEEFMKLFLNDIESKIITMVESGIDYNVKEFYKDYFFLGEERKFIEMFSKTAAFDQYVLQTEQKYKSRGVKLKKRNSVLSWFSKDELVDVDNVTVVTPTKQNQPIFNLL